MTAMPAGTGVDRVTAPRRPGSRNGQRLLLTSGRDRLEGVVTSDSVSWLTLRLDNGCRLAIDLDGWTLTDEAMVDNLTVTPRWVGRIVLAVGRRLGLVGWRQ